MEELAIVEKWLKSGDKVALARVIQTWGSSPRPVGSMMWINQNGNIIGSVSGGCVETSVVKASQGVIEENHSTVLSYGVSDDDAWTAGLSCGGKLSIILQPVESTVSQVWMTLIDSIKANQSTILVSSLSEGNNMIALIRDDGSQVGEVISEEVLTEAKRAYKERVNRTVAVQDTEYFIQIFPKKPQLIIIGAAHITVDLVSLAKQFGFETIVIDPRGFFAKNMVFNEEPDQIFELYPSEVLSEFSLDAYTFCAILSHDPKIDDNALEILLNSEVAYIGALGSRKTHAKRIARLTEKGMTAEMIGRIKAPVGVDINARSAKEIALSIISQIIEVKNAFIFER